MSTDQMTFARIHLPLQLPLLKVFVEKLIEQLSVRIALKGNDNF